MCVIFRFPLRPMAGSAIRPKALFDPPWLRIAQSIIGLFFLTAAYKKMIDSFFGEAAAPLRPDLEWWLSVDWPVQGYRQFLTFMLPHSNWLAVAVITLQALAGLSLFLNIGKRYGAMILLFVQANIFLGTFYGGIGFNTFVGLSLWLGLYYCWEERMTAAKWRALTGIILVLHAAFLYLRFTIGDPWTSAFVWQKSHFAADIMSISPSLKTLVLWISERPVGPWLWASMWWILVLLLPLMLMRRSRLFAGALLLVILTLRVEIWLNGVTSEGVLWVLTVFVWLVAEEAWQRKYPPVSLLPSGAFLRFLLRHVRRYVRGWWTSMLKSFPMKYFPYQLTGWSIFFGLTTVTIFVAFAAPAAFGLQNFNQWGGMYIDRWCHVDLASADPKLVTGSLLLRESQNAGEAGTRSVFTVPMHNHTTCLMWAASQCGGKAQGGWTIAWITASMNKQPLVQGVNICALPLPQASLWFPHAL